ncbi:hypothetical protein FJZ31_03395 [Candidatus Poribacteria bacterium]|nr:hypothetical protein [Candidatus Poribacteria bacterium]
MEQTIKTKIIEIDKFSSPVSIHEEVYIYRRLKDIYDPTAVAVINTKKEVIGYLDRNIAKTKILPKIKKGIKFRCFVTGPSDGESIPISITETEDIESTFYKESVSPIPAPTHIQPHIQLPDEDYVDEKIEILEEDEELEYPDLDELDIEEEDDGDDWDY